MANDLNQCNFIGRLGKDVETRYTQGGDAVANFSIAVGESWKDAGGEKQERTTWVNVVAFKQLATICETYLHKGSRVFVSGKLQIRKYEAKDGTEKYSTEVIANSLQMLDPKPKDEGGGDSERPATRASTAAKKNVDDLDSDIPFVTW